MRGTAVLCRAGNLSNLAGFALPKVRAPIPALGVIRRSKSVVRPNPRRQPIIESFDLRRNGRFV